MRATDRFTISLFIAISAHVLMAICVGFNFSPPSPKAKTLEITLVQHTSKAPQEADFIAQANQQASGTELRKHKLTTTETARFLSDNIQDITPPVQPQVASNLSEKEKQLLVTNNQNTVFKVNKVLKHQQKTLEERFKGETYIPDHLSSDISTLEALLDRQRQAYAKRPRVRRLTSVSAKAAIDAQYLDNWRKRIEQVGNSHYPAEAKRHHLYGELRLAVMLLPNGSVDNIEVLHSSGTRVLDDAAMRIVRLAEPFETFPEALKKDVDKLEIIRTWKFLPGNELQSQ